ncbi:hypothetical protein HG531_003447 [Fusarium graminearum]|nr:hypothetical protein HG531_003447 [Fusarium graminearum]
MPANQEYEEYAYLNPNKLLNVVERLCTSCWLLPARHLVIHHLGALQEVEISGVVVEFLSVNLVGNGNLDCLKSIQNIELCEVQSRIVVDGCTVLDNDKIEPSAPTSAAGRCSPFSSNLLELSSDLTSVLRLESSLANSGRVSLHNTDCLGDVLGVQGVRAVLDIKHEGVSSLNDDVLVALLGCLHERYSIDGVLGELRSVFVESSNFLLDIVYEKISEALAVTSLEASKLGIE